MNLTSSLSAAAATLAAALAAVNLYVLGRRERHRWIREILLGEYAAYLNASFGATSTAKTYVNTAADDAKPETQSAADSQIKEFHDQQMGILTRLRLLAPADVVAAAEDVHRADHDAVILLGPDGSATKPQIKAALENAHAQRENLIRAARESMQVPGKVAKVGEV
jgi:hypothetical protein